MPDPHMKVLAVDDFPTMRRIVKTLLRQLGYTNVVEAEDGQAALTKLKQEKFDLVLLDWNMPRMTGLELLKAIRADDNLRNTPVVMITAEGRKEDVLEAVKAGVNNFIVKPFTAETLEEKLNKVLEKKPA
jgi:two-component system, chemotaxis family, chemotaxis protein CheY